MRLAADKNWSRLRASLSRWARNRLTADRGNAGLTELKNSSIRRRATSLWPVSMEYLMRWNITVGNAGELSLIRAATAIRSGDAGAAWPVFESAARSHGVDRVADHF